jgi:hypothetical protein
MEDILDIYEISYNPLRPVICMDEKPYQLPGESREPLLMRKGSELKTDSEYIRKGTCSIFVFTEPLGGVTRKCKRAENGSGLGKGDKISC